jgi:hypothetical protein
MKQLVFALGLSFILFSCSRNPLKINVSDVSVDLRIKHLDADLQGMDKDRLKVAIPDLKKKYGEFFDIFTYQMIAVGGTDQENFPDLLYSFVSDTVLIRKLVPQVAEKIDTLRLRKELDLAFRHYKYYFPQKEIPVIYTCISGLNQSVVIANNLIGISLDKYLGSGSPFYVRMGLPVYKRRNMNQSRLVPDMMVAWVMAEWPKSNNANSMLSEMIQEGKQMYFVDAMLPDLNDTLKMGYTKIQIDFCRKNEASMWTFLAEHKLLFTTDRMSIKRFIDDGPYTSAFGEQSPSRTGVWIGWQIVQSYMKQHPEVKLADLLANQDFQMILNQSNYQP